MSELRNSDFMLEVAKGKIPGHSQMNKYGHNESVNTGPEDVWGGGGIYDFYFITNQTVEAVSTDVDDVGSAISSGTATGGSVTTLIDTGASFQSQGTPVVVGDIVINDTNGEWGTVNSIDSETQLTHTVMTNASSVSPSSNPNESGDSYRVATSTGTGAGVIHIEGLNDSGGGAWVVATETIVMNGQTDVAITKTFVRQYRAFVLHAGSSGMNEGDITVEVDATTNAGLFITAGDGQTQQAIFTIPSGMTGFFLKGYVGIGSRANPQQAASAVFTWRARLNNGATGVFAIKGQVEVMTTASQFWIYEYAVPVAIPEKSDILIRCDSTTADVGVIGAYDMLLVQHGF
jgi:hypothetical protein